METDLKEKASVSEPKENLFLKEKEFWDQAELVIKLRTIYLL